MKRLCVLFLAALSAANVNARVERVEILSRSDILEGKQFGDVGPYEKLIGKVHFTVKPDVAPNRIIVDLDKALRNSAGEVEFAADVYILKPKETARSSGTALIEIPNRGGKGILRVVQNGKSSSDPTTETEFGDGFLMRHGVTLIWIGWQWDVRDEPGLMRLYAPAAKDDKPITGLIRSDFVVNEKTIEHPLGHVIRGQIGGTEYACSDPDDRANVLTVRDAPLAERQIIPRGEWQFVESSTGKLGPGLRAIRLNSGFESGKIYEIIYRAQDPIVVGLGLAAVRDFASYLKGDRNDLAPVKRVYAMGISQSNRRNADPCRRRRSRELQSSVCPTVAGCAADKCAFLPDGLVPLRRYAADRSGNRPDCRPARPRESGGCAPENLLRQHFLRILVTRRIAHPHIARWKTRSAVDG